MGDWWLVRIVVITFMIIIVISLGSGLFYLVSDRKQNSNTVKALTVRIAVSIILFGFLFVAFAFGWIKPHGLYAPMQTQKSAQPKEPSTGDSLKPIDKDK